MGKLVTRLVSDIDGIANVFSNGLLNAIGDFLTLVVVLTAMFIIDPKLTLIIILHSGLASCHKDFSKAH